MTIYNNIILAADSYKFSHYLQYPDDVTHVSSYIESRGGLYDELPVIGHAVVIEDLFKHPITRADVDEAEEIITTHGLPFNREGWQNIVRQNAGFMPLKISALPEGTIVKPGEPILEVHNTDPRFPWLTSYIETVLLQAMWYPMTVAARSRAIKKVIAAELELTGDIAGLPFKLHDFGYRGTSSRQSAGIGGLGHLINFQGTDTMEAILFARYYYGHKMAGFSIPAAEHSTMTAWGRPGEAAAYRNMVEKFGGGLFAVVSDSYDIYNAVDEIWGGELKDVVMKAPGTLVVRPDSGDPLVVPIEVVKRLDAKFGSTVNAKGYKVLNKVRVIQGDGVNDTSIAEILKRLRLEGYSADNIAFGMGGHLLQNLTRDTNKFAMKASAIKRAGSDEWIGISKDPITDPGKRSKVGFQNVGVTVYENGTVTKPDDFDTIRQRAAI